MKDPALYAAGEIKDHPVVTAIKELTASLENGSCFDSKMAETLNTIQKECDSDLARRCLAGSSGAYTALFKTISVCANDSKNLTTVLITFCSLVNGQPDLIDRDGILLLISLLKLYKNDTEILQHVIRAIRLNCVKHEGNRQAFVEQELILLLTELLTVHKSDATIIKETAICLRSLTMDDDVRVPFGKGPEHAKMIVTEGDAFKSILQLCEGKLNI